MKRPPLYPESRTRHRDAHGYILRGNRDSPKPFCQFGRDTELRPAPLPKNPGKRKGIGSCPHASPAEIFFPVYGKAAGITYNANNSEATRLVRKLLGFPGFLMVQTFHSQES